MSTQTAVMTATEEGQALWHGGALWQFKVTSEQTEGRFWLAELTAPREWASPVHLHTNEDETFVVLEGELRTQVGDEVYAVPEGATMFMPRNVPHAYRVESETARFLVVATPGGFDGWFFETGEEAPSLTIPPTATEPPDYAEYVASLGRYGVQFIAPPPLME